MFRYIKSSKEDFEYKYIGHLPYGVCCLLGDGEISKSELKQHIETALKGRGIQYENVVVDSPTGYAVYGLDKKNYDKLQKVWHKLDSDISKNYYEVDTALEELHKRASNSYTRIH